MKLLHLKGTSYERNTHVDSPLADGSNDFIIWIAVSVICERPHSTLNQTQYYKGAGCRKKYFWSLAAVCGDAERPNLPTWWQSHCRSLKGCLSATEMGTSHGSNRRPMWEDIKEWEHPGQNPKTWTQLSCLKHKQCCLCFKRKLQKWHQFLHIRNP